jgi:hypothetical protein
MQDPNAVAQLVANPDLVAAVSQISSFLSHLTVGATSAHFLQWVKQRPSIAPFWKLMSDREKSIAAATLATLGSLGVTAGFHYDPTKGILTATFAGVTAANIYQHVWSFIQEYVLQTGWYKGLIKATAVQGAPLVAGQPIVPVPVIVAPKGGG